MADLTAEQMTSVCIHHQREGYQSLCPNCLWVYSKVRVAREKALRDAAFAVEHTLFFREIDELETDPTRLKAAIVERILRLLEEKNE